MRGLGSLLRPPRPSASSDVDTAGVGFAQRIEDLNLRPTSYRGAMGIPGAWRCAVLLSDLLGGVPWHAYRERRGRPVERLDPGPRLIEHPSWPDTRMTTFSSWGLDLMWHGNAIGVIAARDYQGYPTAVTPVSAEQVGVRRVRPGDGSLLPVGSIEYSIGRARFDAHDVIHIKGPCEPGALRGMGVLEHHMVTLELAHDQASQARTISRHGVPTGVLKSDNPDLTDTEASELKRKWLNNQSERSIAVLNATTTFEALAWNPEELQLVEARRYSLHELALIFGVPLSILGVEQSNRTYRNDETESINLVKFSLGGHLQRFEQTLSMHVARGTRIKANLDAVLRGDTLTRYQAHKTAIDGGWLDQDEVREIEDLPPRGDA